MTQEKIVKKPLQMIIALAAFLLAAPLFAGVVYEIETTDYEEDPPKVDSMELAAEGRNIKIGIAPGEGSGQDGEMIFRGDRREMIVVNDRDRTYQLMDEAFLKQWEAQVGGADGARDQMAIAREELQKRLGNMTEQQRKALEQALGSPKGGAGNIFGEEPQKTTIRKTGEKAKHGGYPCVRYDILRGQEKVYELWVTDWSNIEGGATFRDAFGELTDFFGDMLDSGMGAGGNSGLDFYGHVDEIGGFPVYTRSFEGGELEGESMLRSARRRTLDPADFEPPSGYKRRSMMPNF